MTRIGHHALALSIVFCLAVTAGAALPQDRQFFATIRTGAPGAEQCLGIAGNDNSPSRTSDANCAPVWRLMPLGSDLYTISHTSAAGEQCLIFGNNGSDASPSRHNWDAGEYCGFPTERKGLLENRQAVFRLIDLGEDRYAITNASGGAERCLIFSNNGTDRQLSRHNWGAGAYCGFPGGKDELLRNGQAIFRITPVPASGMLDVLFTRLHSAFGNRRFHGVTYSLTTDNDLREDWIQQTPKVWGQDAAAVPVGAGRNILNHIRDIIAGAQQHVDITTLKPFPTGEFRTVIQQGLEQLAASGRPVTVRILAGWDPDPSGLGEQTQSEFLRALVADIKDRNRYPNNKLQIAVAAQRTPLPQITWNHGKIVAVDGREMLIGGQNWWEQDYLRENPVHDLTLRVRGSAAALGHHYADEIWTGPCGYFPLDWKPALWRASGDVTTGCLQRPALRTPAPAGNVRMLMIGRLGIDRLITAEPSETAMWDAFERTSGTIRISQQDFMDLEVWRWSKPIVRAVVRSGRTAYLVVGDDYAKGGPAGTYYKYGLGQIRRTMAGLTSQLWESAKAERDPATSIDALRQRLCSSLHIAPLRFGPSKKWPASGFAFANHAKFWMIDDLFYVGSHNLYPAGLQELGVIVESAPHAAQMREQYWDPLWRWSKADAVSGSDAERCVFQDML